ncbi:MAG: GNAT family N-acetyltransferase [Peptococcaceae bacterium]|jgi:RimJ/RimL family protein N-acetyltransferase|nr:GNAT family N-acetyltransferase [Peptococcaceae bacterium]
MLIRRGDPADLPAILRIYADARDFMASSGNPNQWKDRHPPRDMVERDVSPEGRGYVCEDGGEVVAAFYFNIERDPTYNYIDGEWLSDEPYGVVHRIAVKRGTCGVGAFCLNWAFERRGNLRIDTHTDNAPMRKLLDKLGFIHCGTIWILDGAEERMAFQKLGRFLPDPNSAAQCRDAIAD